ncbi:hypothetical protein SAMN03159297_02560 [Pseudomonas sp. NFACC45]|nr:hypothetical protein SAMN03159297_02560 [Pseudomonas sp. NFACC45]
MSRSLGLREDRQWREVLVMRIAQLFPLDSGRCHRGQALLPQEPRSGCGSKACPR